MNATGVPEGQEPRGAFAQHFVDNPDAVRYASSEDVAHLEREMEANGTGIPQEAARRIWQRLDSRATEDTIAKLDSIIERHAAAESLRGEKGVELVAQNEDRAREKGVER